MLMFFSQFCKISLFPFSRVPFRSNFNLIHYDYYYHLVCVVVTRFEMFYLFEIGVSLLKYSPVSIINNRCLLWMSVIALCFFSLSRSFSLLLSCLSLRIPYCVKSQTKIEIRNNPKYRNYVNVEKKVRFFGPTHIRYQSLEGWFKRKWKREQRITRKKEQKATEQTTTTATINKTHEANVIINNKL